MSRIGSQCSLAMLALTVACGSSSPSTPTPPPPPPPPPPTAATVTVTPGTVSLQVGGNQNLVAVVKDAGGAVVTLPVTWTTNNAPVASVNSAGRVTAVTAGNATITATSGSASGSVAVTVAQIPVAAVTVTGAPTQLEVGRTVALVGTARDGSGGALAGRSITWTTSNEAIATVSAAGAVTATGKGAAIITATSEGKTGQATFPIDTREGWLAAITEQVRQQYDLPALSGVIITRAGGVYGMAAAGVRRISSNTPATVNDRWHIGSNLKAITAYLAAILVADGTVTWERTLAEAYPELTGTMLPAYQSVTLRDLLAHTGNLPANLQNLPGPIPAGPLTNQRAAVVGLAVTVPPDAAQYLYSNVGYMIAANMLERAAGTSFESLLSTRLLTPLGITEFNWGPAPWAGGENPIGHQRPAGAWVEGPGVDNVDVLSSAGRSSWSLGAWAAVIRDMLRADQGNSALLTQAAFRATTTAVTTSGVGAGYGLGWISAGGAWANGGRAVAHDGSNNWNFSRAMVALDRGAAVLVATNAAAQADNNRTSNALGALSQRLWDYLTANP